MIGGINANKIQPDFIFFYFWCGTERISTQQQQQIKLRIFFWVKD